MISTRVGSTAYFEEMAALTGHEPSNSKSKGSERGLATGSIWSHRGATRVSQNVARTPGSRSPVRRSGETSLTSGRSYRIRHRLHWDQWFASSSNGSKLSSYSG